MTRVDEIAKVLGCTGSNVCYLLRKGRIKGTRTSSGWQVTDEAVQEYLKEPTPVHPRKLHLLWVDREVKDFTLNPEWKLVRVKVRLHDGTESRQTYLVDFAHSRSALVEADGQPVPVGKWRWMPGVPERK